MEDIRKGYFCIWCGEDNPKYLYDFLATNCSKLNKGFSGFMTYKLKDVYYNPEYVLLWDPNIKQLSFVPVTDLKDTRINFVVYGEYTYSVYQPGNLDFRCDVMFNPGDLVAPKYPIMDLTENYVDENGIWTVIDVRYGMYGTKYLITKGRIPVNKIKKYKNKRTNALVYGNKISLISEFKPKNTAILIKDSDKLKKGTQVTVVSGNHEGGYIVRHFFEKCVVEDSCLCHDVNKYYSDSYNEFLICAKHDKDDRFKPLLESIESIINVPLDERSAKALLKLKLFLPYSQYSYIDEESRYKYNNRNQYSLYRAGDKIKVGKASKHWSPFIFTTKIDAEWFYLRNMDLLKDYFMLWI